MRRAFLLSPFFVAACAAVLFATQMDGNRRPLSSLDSTDAAPTLHDQLLASIRGSSYASPLWQQAVQNDPVMDACVDGFRGACFAEGTSQDYMQQVAAVLHAKWEAQIAEREQGGIAYFVGTGWSSQGAPIALTWSIVPDGLSIPGGVGEATSNSTCFSTMDTKFSGNRALWISRIQQSLDRWGELSGLSFTRVTNGGNDWDDGAAWGASGSAGLRGDLRFACHPIDGGNNILAYADFPPGGDIVLDSGENWQSSTNSHRFMRNIIMHEAGHSIGMFHVCPIVGSKLLEPQLATGFDGPRHDDIRAAHRLYGDSDEPNDTSGTATDLGTLAAGGTITRGSLPAPVSGTNPANSSNNSIDSGSEPDFFKFAITGSRTVSVTVTPVGTTYDSSTQNGNGSCNSGNNIDSLTRGNLGIELRNTNGTSILASADANPAGSAETISNVALVNVGTYFVRVFGTAVTETQMYTLSITATATCVAPTFTLQPSSATVCAGQPTTLNATVDGSAPLTFQWKKNSVDIPGATAEDFTIAAVTAGDAGSYTCAVSNPCGSATSNAAVLTVNSAPSIGTQPTNQNGCTGGSATFSLVASGGSLSYQWRKGGVDIGGATAASLVLSGLTVGSAGTYDCVVSNSCGSVTSNGATLTMRTPPVIVTQPTSDSACVGDPFGFALVAGGSAPLSYQWRKGGVNIPGANGNALDFAALTPGDAGNYDCVITNACTSISSNTVSITLLASTAISGQPSNQSACVGGSASFTVSASGEGVLTYQWKKGVANIGGATSATLNINPVAAGDAGSYTCVVTGGCGAATSNAATLTVNSGPSISQHPANVSACTGQPASFTVVASDATGFQWRKNTVNIPGATSATFNIASVAAGDAGSYDCVVSSLCGPTTSNAATLTLGSGPGITLQPQNQSACTGGQVTFSVTATGATSFQWRKGGVNIGGATGSSLTLDPVVAGDAGSYDVVVSNSCGSVPSDSATLTLNAGPIITQGPQSATGCQNGSLMLTVTANGSPAPTYQWRKGGVPIGGATAASYVISPVTAGDAGSYDVVVSNSCGSTTSSPASVAVQLKGDANCDGLVNNFDIDPFVLAILQGQAAWEVLYSCNYVCANDINRDGPVNNFDIDPFVACVLSGNCP